MQAAKGPLVYVEPNLRNIYSAFDLQHAVLSTGMIQLISHCLQKFKCIILDAQSSVNVHVLNPNIFCHNNDPALNGSFPGQYLYRITRNIVSHKMFQSWLNIFKEYSWVNNIYVLLCIHMQGHIHKTATFKIIRCLHDISSYIDHTY